jgi:hypothetical protein
VTAVENKWHAKLENWALWLVAGGPKGSPGVSSIYRGPDRFRADYVGPRALVGDASDVDSLVVRLKQDHQNALRAWFVWTGSTQDRAASLGCHVDTLRDRVRAACFRLDDLHQAQRRPSSPARQSA